MIRSAKAGRFLSRTLALVTVFVIISGVISVPKAYATLSDSLTMSDVGTSYDLNLSLGSGTYTGGTLTAPLSTKIVLTLDSWSSSGVTLGVNIDNTTIVPKNGLTQAALMSFGFNSTPLTSVSLSTSGTVFTNVSSPGNFPGGFTNINVCMYGGNNCNGGSINDGLQAGQSDSLILDLSTSLTNSSTLTLSDFAVKFQTNEGSYEFGSGISVVPEPESLVLFASALFLGLFGRIRRHFKPLLAGSTFRG